MRQVIVAALSFCFLVMGVYLGVLFAPTPKLHATPKPPPVTYTSKCDGIYRVWLSSTGSVFAFPEPGCK